MSYFDPEVETAPLDRLREIQFHRLKHVLQVVYRNNRFYQRKFREHPVELGEIKRLEDIRKLPFSHKSEFQKDQEHNPPYGTNLSEPLEHYVRYHQTTGTTGTPLKWFDTRESWLWRGKCGAMSLWASGVRPSDIVFFPFSFGPHVAFWGLFEGAWQIGALSIAAGGWDTLQRVRSVIENQATVMCCTPTYALRMAEVARENAIDLSKSALRRTVHAGEPGALVPSIRKKIEEAWGATPYDYSGLTEVGAYGMHCEHQEHAIHVNEGEFIIEVIDPNTEEPVSEGEIGEMVLTNLGRSCSPGIRFRTQDLVRLGPGFCRCGRTFGILDGGVLGRSDDMITIRGMNIFPAQVGEIVERHLVIGEEYQMEACSRAGLGEFKVMVELAEGRAADHVVSGLREALKEHFEIRMEVVVVPSGTLPRSEYKSKRFVDKREEVSRGEP